MRSQKYICWTRKQMRYMLGDHGFSYVVGFSPPNKPGQFPLRVARPRAPAAPSAPANCSAGHPRCTTPRTNPHTISTAPSSR